jgi:hypothetical protein
LRCENKLSVAVVVDVEGIMKGEAFVGDGLEEKLEWSSLR